jgi:ferritin-like metal-binding protein YciE
VNNLQELFHHMLMDVYYAEKKILKSLPKMAEKASSKTLADAFTRHQKETEIQVDRLTEVFGMISEKPKALTCQALDGLVAEAEEIMKEAKSDAVRDAGLLAAAQAVEHYEIARYGTLAAWAKEIGLKDAARLLQQTLDEEHAANGKLDELAMAKLNKQAA